jgi:hypothetical protein
VIKKPAFFFFLVFFIALPAWAEDPGMEGEDDEGAYTNVDEDEEQEEEKKADVPPAAHIEEDEPEKPKKKAKKKKRKKKRRSSSSSASASSDPDDTSDGSGSGSGDEGVLNQWVEGFGDDGHPDDTYASPQNRTLGLGLQLGAPTAITGKYLLARDQAVVVGIGAGLGWNFRFDLFGDYLFFPSRLATGDEYVLTWYLGGGLFLFLR